MAKLPKNPEIWRAIFGTIVFAFIAISILNYARYVSLPTDENWFSTSPSNIYITKSFSAKPGTDVPDKKGFAKHTSDSILVGDLLMQINLRLMADTAIIRQELQAIAPDSNMSMLVYRPSMRSFLPFTVAKSAIPDSFFQKIPITVNIFDVIEGGASDRAGMEVGDLAYRINGSTFTNQNQADAILRNAQVGKAIAYDIIRDGKYMTLRVELAKVGINLSILLMSLCGWLYMGTAALILLKRPQLRAAQLLGMALLIAGFVITLNLTRKAPSQDFFTIVRDILAFVALFFLVPTAIISHYYFPVERQEITSKKWVPVLLFSAASLAILVSMVTQNQLVGNLALLAVMIFSLVVGAVLSFTHRKQCSAEYKLMKRPLRWTMWLVLAAMAAISYAFWNNLNDNTIGVFALPLALIPLSYLYTISQYRLLDLNIRVRRNIQYTIVSALWGMILVTGVIFIVLKLPSLDITLPNIYVTGTGIELADTPMSADKQLFLEKIILMAAAIALCLVTLKIAKAGQNFLNRKFDQGASDYRKAATALAEVMGTNLSMIDLAKGIVQKLALTMHLKRVGVLFFRNQKLCCCQEAYGFEDNKWFDFCLKINPQLVDQIQKFRSESRFSADYLTGDLKDVFVKNGFRNVFIIRSKEKLVGVLLIGEKRSESPFHQDDLEFLTSIAKQSSVAIENAFLYEELAEQERLKHELQIARQIQLASLPQSTPIMDGLEIDGISVPALEVGGDYFDYLNGQPNEITVIVGDVSGKGTSAALYMSKVQGILRSLHGFNLSPRDLFIHANNLLCKDLEKKSFVTAIGGFFNSKSHSMSLARAGHLPLYYYDARSDKVKMVTPKGLGLGLKNSKVFSSQIEELKIEFRSGDVFLFITDGITEAQNETGEEFGEERVTLILKNNHLLRSDEIRNVYFDALKRFTSDSYQHDDQTLVVVKVK